MLTRSDLQVWLRDVMARHPATWVLVTHDIREAVALADRVAVLGGRPAGIAGWVETAADPAGAESGTGAAPEKGAPRRREKRDEELSHPSPPTGSSLGPPPATGR